MTDVLAFAAASPTLTAPTIDGGLPDGFVIQAWIRRTGGEKSQPIVTIAGVKSTMVLGTGERGDALSFGAAGDAKSTIVGAGALPIERWVQVRLVVEGDGDASIWVLGRKVAAGKVAAIGAEARTITIGGGALAFEMAELQIWRHAAPKVLSYGPPKLDAPNLWAYYPLASIEGEGQARVTRDAGPKGRHAAASTAGTQVRLDEDFDPGPSLSARFVDDTEDARMSALGGLGKQVTLEAWVCPEVDDAAAPSVVRVGEASGKLVLAAGGSKGRVALVAVVGTNALPILGIDAVVPKGEWHHVAVSVAVEATKATVALFVDGRLVKGASFGAKTGDVGLGISVATGWSGGGEFAALSLAVGGALTPAAILGGAARGCSRFRGGMAEVRVWRRADAAAIASSWLGRARGDEDGLAACYRLDDAGSGQFVDVSGRRGVAKVPSGVVTSEAGPPLASTRAARSFLLRTRGKLVREHVPVSAFEGLLGGLVEVGAASGAGVPCNVFDATIQVAARSGAGLRGRRLLVRVDSPVMALVGAGAAVKAKKWERGSAQAVTIPGSGTVRLRFLASESRCPCVRVQVEGAAGGLWTLIEPDAMVQAKLRGITGARLLAPGDGRRSPLPAGATREDADALAESLRKVATVMPRRAPRRASTTQASGTARPSGGLGVSRLSWGDVGGALEDGWDAVEDTYDDVVDGASGAVDEVSDGIDAAVEVAVDASIDVSRVATGSANEVVKGAGTATKAASSLVKRADAEISALRTKAAKGSSWVGKEAIRTLVRSADALAVVVDAAAAGRWVEVVGTSIVDGAEVAWRAIVAGVDDALAAAESLVEKVGAKLAEWLEYLAYLFNWGDFVAESDAMTALLEAALTSARGQIAGLAGVKEELKGALRSAIDAAVGQRSLAELFGLEIDRESRAFEQVDYVIECFQQALDLADSALPAAKGAPALAECSAAVLSSAERCGAALPMTSLDEVVGVLTTPVAELCAGKDGAADDSTSLVDFVFDETIGKGVAAFDAGLETLRGRISMGWLTTLMEDVVLCGRKFTALRVLALVAAIPSVLAAKSSGTFGQARSASLDGVVGAPKAGGAGDGRSAAEEQAVRERRRLLWLSMAAGLINSVAILAKTGAELAGKKAPLLNVLMGLCSFSRGYAAVNLLPTYPKKSRAVARTGALFDVVSGVWSMVYGVVASEKRAWLDKVDAGAQVFFCVGVTVNGVVGFALASGAKSSAVASYALRVGSWAGTALVRAVERFDDDPSAKKMKYFTLGLTAVVIAADVAEAVYGNVQDVEATA